MQFCEDMRVIPTSGTTPLHQQSRGFSYCHPSPPLPPPPSSSMRIPTCDEMAIQKEDEDDRASVISAAKALLSLIPTSPRNENVTSSFQPPPPRPAPKMLPCMPMETDASSRVCWIPSSPPHQYRDGFTYTTATVTETSSSSSSWPAPFPQHSTYYAPTSSSMQRKTLPPSLPSQFQASPSWQPWTNRTINRPSPITTSAPISIEMHPSVLVVNTSSSCQSVASSSSDRSTSSLDDMSRHSPSTTNEGLVSSKFLPSALTATPRYPPTTALPVASYYSGTISLATNRDSESLSPLHCFMRRYCVEAFSATQDDVSSPRYGKSHSGRVVIGQVGIRCIHCKHRSAKNRQERAVCFPSSLKNIYHSIETWQRRHSLVCKDIPHWIKNSMTELIHNSKTGAGGRRQYWEESAVRLGMATTNHGIRFIRPPGDLSSSDTDYGDNDGASSTSSTDDARPSVGVVSVQDKKLVTDYLYTLLEQMEACRFTEQDRSSGRSKVKNCPTGFPGMQCKHCGGKAGFGRYFPANVMALSSANSDRNIYNHVIKCRRCPKQVRADLERLQQEQVQFKNRRGSRKQFFQRVWDRLHDGDDEDDTICHHNGGGDAYYTTSKTFININNTHHQHSDDTSNATSSSTFIDISNINNTASV
jgi:hypothetical protein